MNVIPMAPDIRWTEAAGGLHGGVFHGPAEMLENVFMKLGIEWDGLSGVVHNYASESDMVVALGDCSRTFKATGKRFTAPFSHAWQFRDGMLIAFQQHTDTVVHRAPMA